MAKKIIPLDKSDIDPDVNIIREVRSATLGERGRAQYFYHSTRHELPIRDVLDTQGQGHKPEPCIERKAENYCTKCVSGNIAGFIEDDSERFLFLFTRCKNDELDQYGKQFYVGYIEKRRILDVNGRRAVQGPIKLISFENACPLGEIDNPNTRNQKRLDELETQQILEHLRDAENIYHECVKEVEQLEERVHRPRFGENEGTSVPPPHNDDLQDGSSKGC